MSNLSDIIRSVPVDSTASRVVSRGTHHEIPDAINRHNDCWEVCPALLPLELERPLRAGQKIGRLTLKGYLALIKPRSDGKGRVVAQCDCGWFCCRRSWVFVNKSPIENGEIFMCHRCKYRLQLKRGLASKCKVCSGWAGADRYCARCRRECLAGTANAK